MGLEPSGWKSNEAGALLLGVQIVSESCMTPLVVPAWHSFLQERRCARITETNWAVATMQSQAVISPLSSSFSPCKTPKRQNKSLDKVSEHNT